MRTLARAREATSQQAESLWSRNNRNPAEIRLGPSTGALPRGDDLDLDGSLLGQQREEAQQRCRLGASRVQGRLGAGERALWFHLA